ncbi:MAG: hypothetical protein ABW148_05080 [Sedimenticola sp.]
MAEKLNFTKKSLEALPIPESGRAYYLDTKQPRLGLTITPKGTKSFHVHTTSGRDDQAYRYARAVRFQL